MTQTVSSLIQLSYISKYAHSGFPGCGRHSALRLMQAYVYSLEYHVNSATLDQVFTLVDKFYLLRATAQIPPILLLLGNVQSYQEYC